MKPKTLTIAYWISTALFCLWLVGDGLGGVFHAAAGQASFVQLGYPMYLLTLTGVAKILAAIAIIQTKYRTIKEWAFAGYAIDCLGATASWFSVHASPVYVIMPLIFLGLMFIPYYFWKKRLAA